MSIGEKDFEDAINFALLRDDMVKYIHSTKHNNGVDPELIQREKERIIRAQLISSDGNTAEMHDQFYRDHKLLLILFRALAVMPITRSSPGKVTFKWNSTATIYAVFFYIVTSVVVLVVGYERLKILQTTNKFDGKFSEFPLMENVI